MEKVEISHCSSTLRKSDQGASVTVMWNLQNPRNHFEVKFVNEGTDGTTNTVIKSGLRITMYTEMSLKHNAQYSVTVRIMGCPASESEPAIVHTPEALNCK